VAGGLQQPTTIVGRDVSEQRAVGHDALEHGDGGAELREKRG
jgi:hypothetical protein